MMTTTPRAPDRRDLAPRLRAAVTRLNRRLRTSSLGGVSPAPGVRPRDDRAARRARAQRARRRRAGPSAVDDAARRRARARRARRAPRGRRRTGAASASRSPPPGAARSPASGAARPRSSRSGSAGCPTPTASRSPARSSILERLAEERVKFLRRVSDQTFLSLAGPELPPVLHRPVHLDLGDLAPVVRPGLPRHRRPARRRAVDLGDHDRPAVPAHAAARPVRRRRSSTARTSAAILYMTQSAAGLLALTHGHLGHDAPRLAPRDLDARHAPRGRQPLRQPRAAVVRPRDGGQGPLAERRLAQQRDDQHGPHRRPGDRRRAAVRRRSPRASTSTRCPSSPSSSRSCSCGPTRSRRSGRSRAPRARSREGLRYVWANQRAPRGARLGRRSSGCSRSTSR